MRSSLKSSLYCPNMLDLLQANLENQTVLVRLDLDLTNDELKDLFHPRLTHVLSTLDFLLQAKAKLVLIGHRGRPQGSDPSLSLKPLAGVFAKLLNTQVSFCDSFEKWAIEEYLKSSSVVLLENLRFSTQEEENQLGFAQKLSSFAQAYVFEAFAASHRPSATVLGIPKILPTYPGFNFQKEIEVLSKVRNNPERPMLAIIGGAKLETKLPLLNKMLDLSDTVAVGGKLLEESLLQNPKLLTPEDITLAKKSNGGYALETTGDYHGFTKGGGLNILDIGPKTVKKYSQIIERAKTIIWNGPLGYVEDSRFAQGTEHIAQSIAGSSAFKIAGGGENLEAIEKLHLEKQFDHLSLGGGAMIEF